MVNLKTKALLFALVSLDEKIIAYATTNDQGEDLEIVTKAKTEVIRLTGRTSRLDIMKMFQRPLAQALEILTPPHFHGAILDIQSMPLRSDDAVTATLLSDADFVDSGQFTIRQEGLENCILYPKPWSSAQAIWRKILEVLPSEQPADCVSQQGKLSCKLTLSLPLEELPHPGSCPWLILTRTHAEIQPLLLLTTALMKALLEAGADHLTWTSNGTETTVRSGAGTRQRRKSAKAGQIAAIFKPGRANGRLLGRVRNELRDFHRIRPSPLTPDGGEPLIFLEGDVPWEQAREDRDSLQRSPLSLLKTPIAQPYSLSVYLQNPGMLQIYWPGGRLALRGGHPLPAGLNLHFPRAPQLDPSLTRLIEPLPDDLEELATPYVRSLIRGLLNRSLHQRQLYLARCWLRCRQLSDEFPDFVQDLWSLPVLETHTDRLLSLAELPPLLLKFGFIGVAWETDSICRSFPPDQVLRHHDEPPMLKMLKLERWIIRLDRTRTNGGLTLKEVLEQPDDKSE